jgi:hypothetical protein
MVVWKWHAQFSSAAMDDLDGSTGRHSSPNRRCVPSAVRSRAALERDNGRLSNGEQVNRLAALSSVASQLILVAIGNGTGKMFMPKQKLHTQYDETIFRFRVPGGWIYTHTIIRFGSVDKNHVADIFVPDSTGDLDLPIHPTDDPRRDL